MNKLQLYITKSFRGYKVLFNVNPSEEVSTAVHELRRVVEKVHYDVAEKNIFYYVTNIETGTFVVIIRTIPSSPADHLAAWVYVPNELIIDGTTLENVIHTTTRKVSGDRVLQDDVAELRELFGAEYLTEPDAPLMTASSTRGTLGWRAYNGSTNVSLADLLGKGLFQQYYLDYSGVFFVDGDLGIDVDGDNLTGIKISQPAMICPPEKSPEGFTAHVFGRPLSHTLRGTLDSELVVEWKRPGFEAVVSKQVVNATEFTPAIPETTESHKTISASSFQITGQIGNEPLTGAQVLVNGFDVTDTPHSFTQTELVSASVVINCEGYFTYTAHIDLASSTRALIRLQERRKVYCFEMPVNSSDLGAPVHFKIYSKKPLESSPIEGYVLLDDIVEGESRTNHLGYARSTASIVAKTVFFVAGLVVGLLLMMLVKCGSDSDKEAVPVDSAGVAALVQPSTTPTTSATAKASSTATPATMTSVKDNNTVVTADAVKYLDNNKTWTREKLESYACLVGLYDDMNNYRLDRLINVWGPKLKFSKEFARVVKHAGYGIKKVAKRKGGPTYNEANDTKIVLQSYLNRIDP